MCHQADNVQHQHQSTGKKAKLTSAWRPASAYRPATNAQVPQCPPTVCRAVPGTAAGLAKALRASNCLLALDRMAALGTDARRGTRVRVRGFMTRRLTAATAA